MDSSLLNEIIKVVGLLLTGGIGVSIINWFAGREKNKAEINIALQDYWHKEFKRLESRVNEGEEEVKSLKIEIKGRNVTIAELQQENTELRRQLKEQREESGEKIERLTARIGELERLMKKYDIDPDCDEVK